MTCLHFNLPLLTLTPEQDVASRSQSFQSRISTCRLSYSTNTKQVLSSSSVHLSELKIFLVLGWRPTKSLCEESSAAAGAELSHRTTSLWRPAVKKINSFTNKYTIYTHRIVESVILHCKVTDLGLPSQTDGDTSWLLSSSLNCLRWRRLRNLDWCCTKYEWASVNIVMYIIKQLEQENYRVR